MAYTNIKARIKHFLDRGISYYSSLDDKKKVREVNFGSAVMLLIAPLMALVQWYLGDVLEACIILGYMVILVITLYFNQRGANQFAVKLTLYSLIAVTYLITWVSQVQTGACFVNIMIAFGPSSLIKNNRVRYFTMALGFLSFLLQLLYQSYYYPFLLSEFPLTVMLVCIMFVILLLVDKETIRLRSTVVRQRLELEEKNKLITIQAEEKMRLQEKLFQEEHLLMQKNLDSVIGKSSIQTRLVEEVVEKLSVLLKEQNPKKGIKSLILDLKSQEAIQTKLNIAEENIDDINASFYQRLFEKHPKITPLEKELCVYIRLGLSSKEMATLKNSSLNTITVAKTRLRKKLGVASNQDLLPYLVNF